MAHAPYRVEGGAQLRRALLQMGVSEQDFKDIHAAVAAYVGAEGAQRAPRRSGMLAASWRPGSAKTRATVRYGGAVAPYGNAVHWGTGARPGLRGPHNIKRNPFAWAAARETEPTWLDWYLDAMQTMADKAMDQAS